MKQGEVNIRLIGINEVAGMSSFSRRAIRHYNGTPVDVSLSVRAEPDLKDSMISLIVSVIYISTHNYLSEQMLRYTVKADFEIDRLDEHVSQFGADATISTRLMTLMLSVTIGSLRGMLALRTASTALRNYPLPIFNVSEIVSRLHYKTENPADSRPFTNFVYN